MTVKGMETDGGSKSGILFTNHSQTLQQLTTELDNSMTSFEWYGTDADKTREEWNQQVGVLKNISAAVGTMGDTITRNANEQIEVSQK